jgi:casein kinase II subunit beta
MSHQERSWVDWFTASSTGRYFVKVDSYYLNDLFNFFGLRSKVASYRYALEAIRGPYESSERMEQRRGEDYPADLDQSAKCLYGLIHARFLQTRQGLDQIRTKYLKGCYPHCPRYHCQSTVCLPYGPCEELRESPLRLFCPRCNEVYVSDDREFSGIDGAYFGSSWIHLFLLSYPDVRKMRKDDAKPPLRLFGFKIELEDTEEETSDEDGP